jgi:hypothetical protein
VSLLFAMEKHNNNNNIRHQISKIIKSSGRMRAVSLDDDDGGALL